MFLWRVVTIEALISYTGKSFEYKNTESEPATSESETEPHLFIVFVFLWNFFIISFCPHFLTHLCSCQHFSPFFSPAALYIKGNDVTKLASMAKLKGGRLAREVSDSCLQYWGGMGFTSDVLVSRFYRWDWSEEQQHKLRCLLFSDLDLLLLLVTVFALFVYEP